MIKYVLQVGVDSLFLQHPCVQVVPFALILGRTWGEHLVTCEMESVPLGGCEEGIACIPSIFLAGEVAVI